MTFHSNILIAAAILLLGGISTVMGLCVKRTGSSQPSDVSCSTESWPYGEYSMMMAGGKCPDFADFEIGKRYQDLEDSRNNDDWSKPNGFSGRMDKEGYELVFCTKTDRGNNTQEHWPEGDYCIHRKGYLCPSGFKSGSIKFDDENYNNDDKKEGTLPDGIYTYNTKYYFCCRDDGDVRTPIDLPSTKEFYLYPYSDTTCQVVRGMSVSREYMLFDTEDTNTGNREYGSHPWLGNLDDITLYLCHYEPLNYKPK